jgi:hypothetical protein
MFESLVIDEIHRRMTEIRASVVRMKAGHLVSAIFQTEQYGRIVSCPLRTLYQPELE